MNSSSLSTFRIWFRKRAWWTRWIMIILASWFLGTFLMVLSMRWLHPSTTSFMIQGELSAWWNGEQHYELRYEWVDWKQISPHLKMAAIASEDQDFAYHWGIDIGAVKKAIKEYEKGQGLRGASTITQQTAKNLFLWSGQSYIRKGIEAYFALLMELLWPKQRILEMYLNIVQFGRGIYGVQAASTHFFHRPPAQLSRAQSALMVTALPDPIHYNLAKPSSYMRRRQRWVMRYMRLLGGQRYLEKLK